MSDVWTAQKFVNGSLTVAIVMTPGGSFMVIDRGIIDDLRTVNVYDMDRKINWQVTVPGDKDVMHRALEFVRRNRSPPASNFPGISLGDLKEDDWFEI